MKMFGKKSLSTVLFFVSRIIAFGCIMFILFLTFSFLNESLMTVTNEEFQIKLPLLDLYIKGQYNRKIIAVIFLSFLFYGIFFYVLSLIFKVFKQRTIFNKNAISYLSLFVGVNLIAFVGLIGIAVFTTNQVSFESIAYGLMHLILAVFVAFIMAIFKQGFQLQQESDLTI